MHTTLGGREAGQGGTWWEVVRGSARLVGGGGRPLGLGGRGLALGGWYMGVLWHGA